MILGADKLRFESLAAFLEGRRAWVTTALCLVWLLPGLLGRDPWKPAEAAIFGVVYEMVSAGNWFIPSLGGEPFLRHPPFYYWTAALFARGFEALLPLHEGARLVNVLYVGATFGLLAGTARLWFDGARSVIAPLALLGCVGLVQPAHQLLPENAVLTAFALVLFGLALSPHRLRTAAVLVGTGIGLAFLSRGIVSAATLVGSLVLLPIAAPGFRRRDFARLCGIAFAVALPWLLIWPLMLLARAPELFALWLWIEQLGRFWSDLPGAGHGTPGYYLAVLPWFAWPVLPFAAWAVWEGRHRMRADPALTIPTAMFVTALVVSSLAHDKREIFALPLLAPLTVLAAGIVPELRRGAVNVFFWFGITFFLFFLAVVWFYFCAVEFGVPVRAARHMARMEPGYVPSVSVGAIVVAALLTLAWVASLFNVRRSQERPFVTWAIGATTFWSVLMLLMVAWVDHAKSYRQMIDSLVRAMPERAGCLSSLSLGESQRGLLRYFAGIVTLRVENGRCADDCQLLLVEGTRLEGRMDAPWRLLWEGHREGDNRERYRLYRLDAAGSSTPSDATPASKE